MVDRITRAGGGEIFNAMGVMAGRGGLRAGIAEGCRMDGVDLMVAMDGMDRVGGVAGLLAMDAMAGSVGTLHGVMIADVIRGAADLTVTGAMRVGAGILHAGMGDLEMRDAADVSSPGMDVETVAGDVGVSSQGAIAMADAGGNLRVRMDGSDVMGVDRGLGVMDAMIAMGVDVNLRGEIVGAAGSLRGVTGGLDAMAVVEGNLPAMGGLMEDAGALAGASAGGVRGLLIVAGVMAGGVVGNLRAVDGMDILDVMEGDAGGLRIAVSAGGLSGVDTGNSRVAETAGLIAVGVGLDGRMAGLLIVADGMDSMDAMDVAGGVSGLRRVGVVGFRIADLRGGIEDLHKVIAVSPRASVEDFIVDGGAGGLAGASMVL